MRDKVGLYGKFASLLLSSTVELCPTEALARALGLRVFCPSYHLVSDSAPPHVKHLYPVRTVRQFENDLDFLLKHFRPAGVDEVLDEVDQKRVRGKPLLFLSFDDGLREVYETAMPVLLRKGVPAALFLCGDFLDNKDLFYRFKASLLVDQLTSGKLSATQVRAAGKMMAQAGLPAGELKAGLLKVQHPDRRLLDEVADLWGVDFAGYLRTHRPFMTEEEARKMAAKGFAIGAHSLDHVDFKCLSDRQQVEEVRASVADTARRFNPKWKLFAFPFTEEHVSEEVFNELHRPGAHVVDATFGTWALSRMTPSPWPRHVKRFLLEEAGDTTARRTINGGFLRLLKRRYTTRVPRNRHPSR